MGRGAGSFLHAFLGPALPGVDRDPRPRAGRAEGRPSLRPLWKGQLRLCGVCVIPSVARGNSRGLPSFRQPVESAQGPGEIGKENCRSLRSVLRTPVEMTI